MTSPKAPGAVILVIFVAYGATCLQGWLGISYEKILSPDHTYSASVFSHSPLLMPFIRTYQVLVPSQGDLNSHVVFERTSVGKNFTVRWKTPKDLQVVCGGCNRKELVQEQVDSVYIELVKP